VGATGQAVAAGLFGPPAGGLADVGRPGLDGRGYDAVQRQPGALELLSRAGRLDREYVARWWQRAARRLVLAGTGAVLRCFVNAARAGRAPGQLFYAVGALLTPYLVKRRLDALESSARPGPDWRLFADRWLAPWRDELVRSDH